MLSHFIFWQRKIGIIFVFLWVSIGCIPAKVKSSSAESRIKPISIIATTGYAAEMVKQIGGRRVNVTTLFTTSADPHTYEPSLKEIALVRESDLIVVNGLGLEVGMEKLVQERLKVGKAFQLGNTLDAKELLKLGDKIDPHIWNSVETWSKTVPGLVKKLSELEPESAHLFSEQGDEYQAALGRINSELKSESRALESGRRVIIASHNSFAYFAKSYGWISFGASEWMYNTQEYPEGNNPFNLLRKQKISAIFIESTYSPKGIVKLQSLAAKNQLQLKIAGPLLSDSLGNPEAEVGTYTSTMRANMQTLVEALK